MGTKACCENITIDIIRALINTISRKNKQKKKKTHQGSQLSISFPNTTLNRLKLYLIVGNWYWQEYIFIP